MLFVAILVLFGCVNAQSNDNGDTKTSPSCILPPQPKNGHYKILEPEINNLSPGDQLSNFALEISCDPGYHLTDSVVHLCLDGLYSETMSECLPQCSKVRAGVLSCGMGDKGLETRCLMQDHLFTGDNRINHMEKESNCGTTGPAIAEIISGGRVAVKKELPWHAAIYTKKTQPYMQICGGSIVKENIIISAAHCFWSDVEKQRPAEDYAVAVGKIYRPWNDKHDEDVQKSDVAEIRIPPRFQGSTTNLQDDIALVIVTNPFRFTSSAKPVCLDFDAALDRKQLTPNNLGKVAGWGLTGENEKASPVLKVVELPLVAIEECIAKTDPAFKVHITSDKICAGYQNGTAVCKGDSGGGLSFPESVNGVTRYFLRGVVSAAPRNQNLCNTLSWATFTHMLKHEHFIRETIPATVLSTSSSTIIQQPSQFLQTAFLPLVGSNTEIN